MKGVVLLHHEDIQLANDFAKLWNSQGPPTFSHQALDPQQSEIYLVYVYVRQPGHNPH